MYIAVCDDQIEELETVMGLLQAWQTDRRAAVRLRSFRSAGELLDAAQRDYEREQLAAYEQALSEIEAALGVSG